MIVDFKALDPLCIIFEIKKSEYIFVIISEYFSSIIVH